MYVAMTLYENTMLSLIVDSGIARNGFFLVVSIQLGGWLEGGGMRALCPNSFLRFPPKNQHFDFSKQSLAIATSCN